jgi:hypothetical protein
MAQSERRIRIIEAGGESLGLEQHAFGHVAPPAFHRGAKYPKGQAALRKMRGYREPIRTRSNDDSIYIHDSVQPLAGSVSFQYIGVANISIFSD